MPKFTPKVRERREQPIEVDVNGRSDNGVNIRIEGYVFIVINHDGTVGFNHFHESSPMNEFCKRVGMPTVSAPSSGSIRMRTLVLK